ncbi:MAG: pantoate--beta-alanine ligase, partial [Elusimicrobia bacterium]|nr:pantoate--beta-alanine ligase [Elusimicrobiota bacterium]
SVAGAARAALRGTPFRLQYAEVCDAGTLEPAGDLRGPRRLLAAACLGRTRLIDNIALEKRR